MKAETVFFTIMMGLVLVLILETTSALSGLSQIIPGLLN